MENNHAMVVMAEKLFDHFISWRRQIHQNPELSFKEYKTSSFVAETLSGIEGMEVRTGKEETGLPTGVVGILSKGKGPTIALRADMDALPIEEKNKHSFISRNQGVMHACGHDAHTSILLGIAHLLSDTMKNSQIEGTIKFIFQPAEEDIDQHGSTGAPYMIKAGVLQDVDFVLALHVNPENPLGEIKVHDHYSMASIDVFEAKITGTGGHAAYPNLGTDPVWMLGPVLQAINGIVSRRINPLEPGVVSVTQVHAGTASNVIPTEVYLQGTLRSYDFTIREQLIKELEQALSIVKPLGGDYSLEIHRGEPALDNHPVVNQWLRKTIQDLYPNSVILDQPFGLGGEDFGHMTKVVPGSMIFLGCAIPDNIKRDLHTPVFDIDEKCLPMGAAILAETVKRYLNGAYHF